MKNQFLSMKSYLKTKLLKIGEIRINSIFVLFLFIVSMAIYLFTHFWRLEDFPIYFFCDEAIQAVQAEELIKNGFRDEGENFLPIFFKNFYNYNLSLSVYANLPGVFLFGKKIFAVRGTTVLISFIGAIYCALIAKKIYKIKNYWAPVLFLSSSSLFFLHSRTGFETAIATSFFAPFLYYYLLSRTQNPRYIFLSLLFAAASFYSFGGMWPVIGGALLLFILLDFSFFLKNWKIYFWALVFALVLFYPFISFQLKEKDLLSYHLKRYDSYLVLGISNQTKLEKFIENYKTSFSLKWLFYPNETHHPRHSLKGYGYFPSWAIIPLLAGVIYLLAKIRKPESKILLASLLVSPLGGAMVRPEPTRNLPMAIPLAILFSLGLGGVGIFGRRLISKKVSMNYIFFLIWLLVSIYSLTLTYESVINGPVWFKDYGLFGMQYGSKQLFGKINQALDEYSLAYGPTEYTNGTDVFVPFFLSDEKQERFKFWDEFCDERFIDKNQVIFITHRKYQELKKCNLPMEILEKDIITAPSGENLFYEVELKRI